MSWVAITAAALAAQAVLGGLALLACIGGKLLVNARDARRRRERRS